MRPISVEFQAFGPYKDKEIVDFESLSTKGLFLICGETGSGKTMILDAITYALYGKSSGSQREDLQSARCKNAKWGVDTYVDFRFEAKGKVYRFERRLECKRSNLSAKQNAYVLNDNQVFEPLFENCKDVDMRKTAQELIGMDYDQFRQVILLPQGQFEKLLTADSSEKEQVLVNIFGVDKWSKIASRLYDNAEMRLVELKRLKEQITNRLMDEACKDVAELEENILTLQKELEEQAKLYTDSKYEEKKSRLKKVRELLVAEDSAKKDLSLRVKNNESMKLELEDKKASVIKSSERVEALEGQREAIEGLKVEIIRFEDKLPYYEGYEKLGKNLLELEKQYKKLEASVEEKKADLEKARTAGALAGEEVKKLNEEYTLLLNMYINGIVGGLAKDLVSGQPCPVCGSREHPSKAPATDENVSKTEVDKKAEELSKSQELFEKAKDGIENAGNELLEMEGKKGQQANAVAMARQELLHAKDQLIDDITTIDDLNKLIDKKRLEVSTYEKNLVIVKNELENTKNAKADLEGKLKNALLEIEKAEMRHKECAGKIKENLVEYGEELTIEECNKRISDIEALELEFTSTKTRYEVLISNKTKKLSELKKLDEEYTSQITEATSDWNFAKSLRGDTGIGLQRYVLGIMFSSVIAAANRMLEKVHGGRYRLYRTDEKVKGSNKKGLELFVYDSFSGSEEGRSVKTLSGGEKFLVSLALSIGLSTVARRSGIHLDAMFIDEGFGSLDQNSIEDAMDILMGIQKANGVVGIISHVQLLKDNIPTKLEIVKTKEGSKIIKN